MIGKIPTWWENSVRERKKVFRCMDHLVLRHPSYMRGFTYMDHLVLRHPSYMRGFTYPFSLSVAC